MASAIPKYPAEIDFCRDGGVIEYVVVSPSLYSAVKTYTNQHARLTI